MKCSKCYYETKDGENIEFSKDGTQWQCPKCFVVKDIESDPHPVISLKDYTPIDKIKHVTYTRMEIEQIYKCQTCGPLQVINGVCIHTKPDEEHVEKTLTSP